MRYTINFAEVVKAQLRILTAGQRKAISEAIEAQLVYEPLKQTRNKKPLKSNSVASWELRVDKLRVYYDVDIDEPDTVTILAIGLKIRNKVYVAGEELKL